MSVSRVLVVGGNGFIGSHLVDGLIADGREVRVLDVTPRRGDVAWPEVDYRIGGLHDEAALDDALDGVDAVFHLASSTVPGTSNLDPVGDVQANLVGSMHLMRLMSTRGVRRIVFFSSGGTVYGDPCRVPVAEDDALLPLGSYGIVKLAIERYLWMHAREGRLEPLVLRPGNPYGPRQRPDGAQGLVAICLDRVSRGLEMPVWGDGRAVRDYVFIDDLVRLVVAANASRYTGTLNVGSGRGHTVLDILAQASRIVGRAASTDPRPARPFDVRELVLDISRARAEFGWEPRVSLEEGMERTWQWQKSISSPPGTVA